MSSLVEEILEDWHYITPESRKQPIMSYKTYFGSPQTQSPSPGRKRSVILQT